MTHRLALSAAEQATVQQIIGQYPGLVDALREHVMQLINAVVPRTQGVVMTEAQLDDLLLSLADRIVASMAPEEREATEGDVLAGSMVWLVSRHLLAEAQADVLKRLVSAKAN